MSPTAVLDIEDVEQLQSDDLACMVEVAAVLKARGKEGRFDLALRHTHFGHDGLGYSEMHVEHNGPDDSLITTTVPMDKVDPSDGRPTVWRLDGDEPVAVKMCVGSHGGGDTPPPGTQA